MSNALPRSLHWRKKCEGIARKGPFAVGLAFYQVVTDMWNVKGIGEKGVEGLKKFLPPLLHVSRPEGLHMQ